MKLTLLTPGKMKQSFYADAQAEFGTRIAKFCDFAIIETKEEPIVKNRNDDTLRKKEAEVMRDKIPSGAKIVCLDKSGKTLASRQFAEQLQVWEEDAQDVFFVIGGALGLHETLLRHADATLSLGKMTLTQDLARVVLLEQVFRGFTIVRGIPFHR